jgi:hypothetical protein
MIEMCGSVVGDKKCIKISFANYVGKRTLE